MPGKGKMSALCAFVAVLAVLRISEAHRSCAMPEFAPGQHQSKLKGSSHYGSSACKVSSDCCGNLECEGGKCVMGKETDARETAFVAHYVLNDGMNHAVAMALDMESASQAIANASAAVKRTAAKARGSIDKAVDKAAAKAEELKKQLKEEQAKMREKGHKTMEDLRKQGVDIIDKVTENSVEMNTDSSSGFDKYYKDYMKGASGSPDGSDSDDDDNSESSSNSKNGGGSSQGDWQKYIPGFGGKNNKNSASGGFHYEKYVPGSKKQKEKNNAINMAASFDFSEYMGGSGSSGGNSGSNASKKGQGGGSSFDWHKYVPGGGTDDKKNVNMAASDPDTAKEKDTDKGMDQGQGQDQGQKPGTEGAPCGKTPYKDFGGCKKKYHCETHPLFTSFAPGKCVDKMDRRRMLIEQDESPSGHHAHQMKTSTPGDEGGPCGEWKLGGMDFGQCKDDLVCMEQKQVMLTFFDETYGLPSICKNKSTVTEDGEKYSLLVSGDDGEDDDDDDDDYDDNDEGSVDAMKEEAKMISKKASDAAMQAADQAELIGNKLLAAAAKVKEAAAKLSEEATMEEEDSNGKDVSMLEIPVEAARSNVFSFSLVAVGATIAAFLYRKSVSQQTYRRI